MQFLLLMLKYCFQSLSACFAHMSTIRYALYSTFATVTLLINLFELCQLWSLPKPAKMQFSMFRNWKDIEWIRKYKYFRLLSHNCYTYILYSKDIEMLLARTLVVNRLLQILLTPDSCLLSQLMPGSPLTLTRAFTCTV